MRIQLSSVYVDDQDKALCFYTDVLGFVKETRIPTSAMADVHIEFKRLRDRAVVVTQEPAPDGAVDHGGVDDTCGNLLQIAHGNT